MTYEYRSTAIARREGPLNPGLQSIFSATTIATHTSDFPDVSASTSAGADTESAVTSASNHDVAEAEQTTKGESRSSSFRSRQNKRKVEAIAEEPSFPTESDETAEFEFGAGWENTIPEEAPMDEDSEPLRKSRRFSMANLGRRASVISKAGYSKARKGLKRATSAMVNGASAVQKRKSILRRNENLKNIKEYYGSPDRKSSSTRSTRSTRSSRLSAPTFQRFAPETFKKLDRKEQKRQEAIYELTFSESQYVETLSQIIKVIKEPMRKMKIITDEETKLLFSNIEEICQIHRELNSILEAARETDIIEEIGNILLDWFPKLTAYKDYCANIFAAKHIIDSKNATAAPNSPWTQMTNAAIRSFSQFQRQTLYGLIDQPRRRLQRYQMYLGTIIKHTPCSKTEYKILNEALVACTQSCEKINNHVRMSCSAKLSEIQSTLETRKVDLVQEGRPLILERDFHKDGKTLHHLFLFEHMLLITKQKHDGGKRTIVGKPIPIEHLEFGTRWSGPQRTGSFNSQASAIGEGRPVFRVCAQKPKTMNQTGNITKVISRKNSTLPERSASTQIRTHWFTADSDETIKEWQNAIETAKRKRKAELPAIDVDLNDCDTEA